MISARHDSNTAIEALKSGAAEFLPKPERLFRDDDPAFRELLLTSLAKHSLPEMTDMPKPAEVTPPPAPTRSSFFGSRRQSAAKESAPAPEPRAQATAPASSHPQLDALKSSMQPRSSGGGRILVALVCSTGGPKALQYVIPKLPANLNAPVVMVQHMPKGFTASLGQRLDVMSQVKVAEAVEGQTIEKGHVYIAKGGLHMLLKQEGRSVQTVFDDSPPIVGLKPCGNLMYESIIKLDCYDEIVCVVLTGMGSDGTKGIKALKDAGKKIYVIAQDEPSCTVYGMPKAIFDSGLTDVVCDIHEVADQITKKVGVL